MQKTLDRFNKEYWCSNIRLYIQAVCKNCSLCFHKRLSKRPKKLVSVALKSLAPNESWYIDYKVLETGVSLTSSENCTLWLEKI